MSELNIKIRRLQDNGSTFRATPESLYMGGVGSAKVDTLCFDVPDEWKGCAITLHVQRLSGTLPDPQLLDEKNRAVVDQRWTKEKQGLWMLMAVGADGYTAMTKPGRYTCYETIDRDSTTETITPSVYEQFVALVKKETAEANRAAKNAAASAEIAKSFESTITATGEQVQREITATADQTKQAIDEKAKAALASIPEDYTALSESVGQVKEDLSSLFSEPYIPVSARTTVDIVNGNDVFSNVSLKSGNEYVVLSDYTGILYVYNENDTQNRYYFVDGYCEFTPNGRTMVSGSGTFTAKLIFVDVTDKPEYKNSLKKNGFDYAGKYHVGYKDLDELVSENFISLTNIWNSLSSSIAVKSDSIEKSNINGNNFDIKINANNKDGYIIFQETLKAGHKYAIFYNVKANSNYKFSLRLYDSGWKQIIITAHQTANVVATDTTFVSVNTNGNFSMDLTSENNGDEFNGTLKVYDITGLDNIVETFDFESLKDKTVELKVNRSQQTASDNHLNGKKVVFYGDSITAQNKFPVIVKEYYGINAVNMGVGGSTIFYRSNSDMSSDARINNIPSDADIVMVMGGTNDWGKIQIEDELTYSNGFDRTKFKGAIAYIVQHIQAQCPNAKIIWCTTIGGQNETRATSSPTIQHLPQKDRFDQSCYTFRNAEIEVCNILGIEVCDTWSCGINGNNAYTMIGDTVHPTGSGAKLIANYIIGYLKSVII